MKIAPGIIGLVLLLTPVAAVAQEEKPEVLHCVRMAHALKSQNYAQFGVKLKRYRNIAGMIRVSMTYAGLDSDGAGTTGSFECRFRSNEVREGMIDAAAVFIDQGRLSKDALKKYNAIAGSR